MAVAAVVAAMAVALAVGPAEMAVVVLAVVDLLHRFPLDLTGSLIQAEAVAVLGMAHPVAPVALGLQFFRLMARAKMHFY
jgi:hypothetical protein